MSTQIAVRLPDELVAFVDEQVALGRARSRAELVSRLLAREARRQRAEEDLVRMRSLGVTGDPDLAEMVRHTSRRPRDLD